jgi:hypothetical protein
VCTPRGGYHLYYHHNGEHNQANGDEKIDVRGQGGFVILPPSFNPLHGKSYHFVSGGLEDFDNLPLLKASENSNAAPIREGVRNKELFRYLRKQAHECESLLTLKKLARAFGETVCNPPLPHAEIDKTAASVWSYKQKGRLFRDGEQNVIVPYHRLTAIRFDYPRAFVMYCDLLACHGNMREEFAISNEGYRQRSGWDIGTIRETKKVLVDAGLLEVTHHGGKCQGDATLYAFKQ